MSSTTENAPRVIPTGELDNLEARIVLRKTLWLAAEQAAATNVALETRSREIARAAALGAVRECDTFLALIRELRDARPRAFYLGIPREGAARTVWFCRVHEIQWIGPSDGCPRCGAKGEVSP